MVLIDGKKFACSACIKGHRSTSCAHTNRTLVEIGKKGRPPTQCAHCRELRRTSKVHSKCMCGDKPSPVRQLQILPSGTTIQLDSSPCDAQADTIQLINQIFNPCSCSVGGPCCCSTPAHPTVGTRANNPKKKTVKSFLSDLATCDQQTIDLPINQSISRPSCCSSNSTCTESSTSSVPLATLPPTNSSAATDSYTPYLTSLPLPSISSITTSYQSPESDPSCNIPSTSYSSTSGPSAFRTEPTLFAPQTAGTALCFCGIHCPCPGCALHDPLGLKFNTNSNTLCPTSMVIAQDCIAGLDLPTVNQLLNLSPMPPSFPQTGFSSTEAGSSPPVVNLPSVSQALGIPLLSDSTGLSLSQTNSSSMMAQSSNSINFGFASNSKHSSSDVNAFHLSDCGNDLNGKSQVLSHNSEPSMRACCAPSTNQNNNATGRMGCCSRGGIDEDQQSRTSNKLNPGGCCKINQFNSPPSGEQPVQPPPQLMSAPPCIL